MYHHLYHNDDNDADEEKHQEQNEEAHPIKKIKETDRGENKSIRSRDEKQPFGDVFLPISVVLKNILVTS